MKDKITFLFNKIKKAHDIYVKVSNDKQIKIIEAFDFIFKDLETMGVSRSFSESLLMYGKEFVDSLSEHPIEPSCPLLTDDPNSSIPAQEKRATPQYYVDEPIEPQELKSPTEPTPATIEDAEAIFGVKAEDMTDREQREFALAGKNKALVWESLPTPGDTVKIKVLLKEK